VHRPRWPGARARGRGRRRDVPPSSRRRGGASVPRRGRPALLLHGAGVPEWSLTTRRCGRRGRRSSPSSATSGGPRSDRCGDYRPVCGPTRDRAKASPPCRSRAAPRFR
jgi:hypothetical protein